MEPTSRNAAETGERPAGVYVVALYFVLAGFLEAIRKYQESEHAFSLNPLAENSGWPLAVDPVLTLGLALLIWHYASLGRRAALVYGYAMLLTHAGIAASYFLSDAPLTLTPLRVGLAAFDVLILPLLLAYLQPQRQKQLFCVSLWDILVRSD